MKKEKFDSIFCLILTLLIAGTVYETKYLLKRTVEFHMIDLLFVIFVYEVITIKRMLFRLNEKMQEYAMYFKIYFDTKHGAVSIEEVRQYFMKLKDEMEKNK